MLTGPFDPLRLAISILNSLMSEGILSYEEGYNILKSSLNPEMSESEQESYLKAVIRRIE